MVYVFVWGNGNSIDYNSNSAFCNIGEGMKKLLKNKKMLLLIALGIMGAISVIFGKTIVIKGGLALLFWSLAVFTAVSINNDKNMRDLIEYDEQAKLILIDIDEKGEESEYYTIYNADILNAIRAKEVKKQNKQRISCIILGIILMITCFICFI